MAPHSRSHRKDQELARTLRQQGLTWVQIAGVFRTRYHCTPRAALRLAHGWSQGDAAQRWNERWPSDMKSFKNFSYWERWPSATGHAPSFDVLDKLARLYQCAVTDLLADCPSYRHADKLQANIEIQSLTISSILTLEPADAKVLSPKLAQAIGVVREMDPYEISRIISSWTPSLGAGDEGVSLAAKLSEAFALAAESGALAEGSVPEGMKPWIASKGSYHDLTGIWRSRYTYRSSQRKGEFETEHYVVARQSGEKVTAESVPHSTGSQVGLDLVLDGAIASGRWWERTPKTSSYHGASYHGVIQLVIDPRGQRLGGRWLGFNSKYEIGDGLWELECVDSSTSSQSQRQYHFKA